MKTNSGLLMTILTCFAVAAALSMPLPAHAGDTFSVILSFPGGTAGGPSYSTLISDASGNLYGTTVWGGIINSTNCGNGCGVVYELTPTGSGYTETVLYSFAGGDDGYSPDAGVVFDSTGNLYGTTSAGGTHGAGTVFELSPGASGWTKTILYNLPGGKGASYPESVTFDSAGNLYVPARQGGAYNFGLIFQLTPSATGWIEHTLHVFTGGKDGGGPNTGLVFDASGNLYGTTANGGSKTASICQTYLGCGVVFELSSSSGTWKETVLHTFTGGTDGGGPSGVTIDSSGNLYGTAVYGGNTTLSTCVDELSPGCGVAFKLEPSTSGWRETVLHNFSGGTSGATPQSGMTFDASGNLYGTTVFGGTVAACPYTPGCGTVFELSPNASGGWTASLLHRFTNGKDGTGPLGLFIDSAGNVFGTTAEGGVQNCSQSGGCGAVFEISPSSGDTRKR
jgi:uncharacterized repeat protein (TIGR03803 family)